jgi:pimeloyl-ACP methyl ester carboxylesterase
LCTQAITYASNAGSLWQNVARAPCRALFIVGPDAFQFGPNTQAQAFALAARFGSALTASKCKPSAALLLKHGHHFFPLAQPKLFARIVRAELMSEFSQTKTSKL